MDGFNAARVAILPQLFLGKHTPGEQYYAENDLSIKLRPFTAASVVDQLVLRNLITAGKQSDLGKPERRIICHCVICNIKSKN